MNTVITVQSYPVYTELALWTKGLGSIKINEYLQTCESAKENFQNKIEGKEDMNPCY